MPIILQVGYVCYWGLSNELCSSPG